LEIRNVKDVAELNSAPGKVETDVTQSQYWDGGIVSHDDITTFLGKVLVVEK
jgi:hypothetical protein